MGPDRGRKLPVERIIPPLTPTSPALLVRRMTKPEEVQTDVPETMAIEPPVCGWVGVG